MYLHHPEGRAPFRIWRLIQGGWCDKTHDRVSQYYRAEANQRCLNGLAIVTISKKALTGLGILNEEMATDCTKNPTAMGCYLPIGERLAE